MKVTSLSISNFRAFSELPTTQLGQINVLIGPNNTGKSSVLRALYSLQQGASGQFQDVRLRANQATIQVGVERVGDPDPWVELHASQGVVTLTLTPNDPERTSGHQAFQLEVDGRKHTIKPISNRTPNHFIVPFLSKRKAVAYGEDVRQDHALQVSPNFGNLAAKLSRIANPTFPSYADYSRTCKEMLGFVVTAIPSQSGQRPGIYLPDQSTLFIDQLGEGVPNIVGMLADLTSSEGKLFLIEEPENDLHPGALKALLELILIRAKYNQFVISTHSNIVLRHLGSHSKCKIFSVTSIEGVVPPEASLAEIDNSPEARLSILETMGYGLSDFELWDGWLILEESSAERIIRDYLIPWFVPKLSRLRTLSARGVHRVESVFDDYFRLVCFAHLEKIYRNRTWVRVDGDEPGIKAVKQVRKKFSSWDSSRFEAFAHKNFERYYPQEFAKKVEEVLALKHNDKRNEKKALLDKVLEWLDEDEVRARQALAESAEEIVTFLRRVEENF
mgnify:CR=1 FL=1